MKLVLLHDIIYLLEIECCLVTGQGEILSIQYVTNLNWRGSETQQRSIRHDIYAITFLQWFVFYSKSYFTSNSPFYKIYLHCILINQYVNSFHLGWLIHVPESLWDTVPRPCTFCETVVSIPFHLACLFWNKILCPVLILFRCDLCLIYLYYSRDGNVQTYAGQYTYLWLTNWDHIFTIKRRINYAWYCISHINIQW